MTKKEKVIKVTPKEKKEFLEGLVFKGYALYTKKLLDDKLTLVLKSLNGKEQLDIEKIMYKTPKSSSTKIMHEYSIWLLAYSVVSVNTDDISGREPEEKYEYLVKKPGILLDLFSKTYNEFNNKLQACTNSEELDETFFETPSTSTE